MCRPACQQLGKNDSETAVAEETKEQAIEQADRHYDKAVLKDPTIANRHFQQAAEDFLAGKYGEAAAQIREGAGAWYDENAAIGEFARKEKDIMLASLRQLAQQVENREVYSVDRLNYQFSQTDLLSAKIQLKNTQAYLSQQDYDMALTQGQQGLSHLEQALHRTEQSASTQTMRLVEDLRLLLHKIARGEPVAVDTLSLKADSARVAIETLTVPQDEVVDVDTAYRAVPQK